MNAETLRNVIREKIVREIGARRFNQCVDSVDDTARIGRLRFWQEEWFKRVLPTLNASECEFIEAFGEFDCFIDIFKGAGRLEYSVTRYEFRETPSEFYLDEHCVIPDEYIAFSLGDADFREFLFGNIVEGQLFDDFAMDQRAVRVLRKHLTGGDWLEFVDYVRHELGVPTEEWRDQFLEVFPEAARVIRS